MNERDSITWETLGSDNNLTIMNQIRCKEVGIECSAKNLINTIETKSSSEKTRSMTVEIDIASLTEAEQHLHKAPQSPTLFSKWTR